MRMYLKLISAADMFLPETNIFKPEILECDIPMTSSLGFPSIKPFPSSWKKIWKSIILTIILPRVRSVPLGNHISSSHLNDKNFEQKYEASQNDNNEIDFSNDIPAITSPLFHEGVQHIKKCISQSEKWKRYIWGKSRLSH